MTKNTFSLFSKYLERHTPQVDVSIDKDFCPDLVVVIPCYDELHIRDTLLSLHSADWAGLSIELIVVVNSGEHTPPDLVMFNRQTYDDLVLLAADWRGGMRLSPVLLEGVKKKHAGVGYARKVGMDLAVKRFADAENCSGIILSLDADTLVESNYFVEVHQCFVREPHLYGVIIRFAHPIQGGEYPQEVYDGIIAYELHLRYLNQALKLSGFPYVHHTVGSAFAISVMAYVRHGGMNRRLGGEDFYFLHKLFPHGSFVELNTTCVYPASRPSHRVPFGTGPQIQSYVESGELLSYCPESFLELKAFVKEIPCLFEKEYVLRSSLFVAFLAGYDFDDKLEEIRSNSSSLEAFVKRFYSFFDAFKVVKYLNYSHQERFVKADVVHQANSLLQLMGYERVEEPRALLAFYRKIESR